MLGKSKKAVNMQFNLNFKFSLPSFLMCDLINQSIKHNKAGQSF